MRFLVDANLSPKIAIALNKAGLESVHVSDAGLLTAPDRTILEYAAANDLVIVSADSDFGPAIRAVRGIVTSRVVNEQITLRGVDAVDLEEFLHGHRVPAEQCKVHVIPIPPAHLASKR